MHETVAGLIRSYALRYREPRLLGIPKLSMIGIYLYVTMRGFTAPRFEHLQHGTPEDRLAPHGSTSPQDPALIATAPFFPSLFGWIA